MSRINHAFKVGNGVLSVASIVALIMSRCFHQVCRIVDALTTENKERRFIFLGISEETDGRRDEIFYFLQVSVLFNVTLRYI